MMPSIPKLGLPQPQPPLGGLRNNVLGQKNSQERDLRIASRLRGAMRSVREGESNCEILVPIHQARLNEIAEALSTWPECEHCEEGGA